MYATSKSGRRIPIAAMMALPSATLRASRRTASRSFAATSSIAMVLKFASSCVTRRCIGRSRNLPGTLDATSPQDIDLSRYDLVALAMQEPQYTNHTIRVLMIKIAEANLPCLSIMNMPPLPYPKRIPGLADMDLEEANTNAQVWERFKPGPVSLCSPDPQP